MRSIRFILAACAALSVHAPFAQAQVAEGPSRTFAPRDLFSLEYASDPQFRPDGGGVAYVRVANDIMTDRGRRSIWLVDPKTGVQSPLVADERSNSRPRWSPDGKRLAYVVSGPDGSPQIHVRWMDTGRSAQVAVLEQAPGDLAWSPDGKSLAILMLTPDEPARLGASLDKPEGAKWAPPLKVESRMTWRADGDGELKPGFSQVFVVSADGGAPRQLTFGKFDANGPLAWSRDGRSILFASNRAADWENNPNESEIFKVSVADGALTQLTRRVGPDAAPEVSPDGRQIAYLGYDDKRRSYENVQLYVMGADGQGARSLTASLDRSIEAAKWSRDGRSLVVSYDDHGITKLARVGLDGAIRPLAEGLGGGQLDRPYTGGAFSVADNGAVAFTQGAPDRPADLALASGGSVRRLTSLNADLLAGKTLGKVEKLTVASSHDGKPIDAWIVTPPNFDPAKKYPLILEIHGGPFSAYGPTFSTDNQLYAAAGYVVVYSNPRGSTSYGAAFANEIDKTYPSHDYDDLMSVVDGVVAKGFVDPKRLYVTGGSGGGLLTAWIVGKTDRFRAAATQKPVINWTSQVLTVDGANFMAAYWFGKMPWEDPQGYWARSPLSLVGDVKTPTLVVVGDQDLRTPVSESEQYYQALRLRGVPTAFVRVPGASHGGLAARPSQSAAKAQAIIAWFERYK